MKPELLAPAGSIESFHAAIDGGADAVYVGLADFNARLRAKNFTSKTLSYLAPYAHKRNVKLYVTLNTLIKQAELEPVVHTLHQLQGIGVDALIVADLGLIEIARKHFPRLRLHASTQMAVHNSAGVRAAELLGLRRVILSRECTLEEIGSIKKQSAAELEVFVHGALCYCISGLCLASSFLGGSSGNRGRCTQACRRKFSAGAGKGFYFSPNDLCAVAFLPQLAALGVACFKIEGRMKTAAYVFSVVNTYRRAIDGDISIEKAQELLEKDLGRKKTRFFFGGTHQSGIIAATARSGIGELVGTVKEAQGGRIVVDTEIAVHAHDRVRIQPESGFDGTAADIHSVSYVNGRAAIVLKTAIDCAAGDAVFLVSRHDADLRFDCDKVSGVDPITFTMRHPGVRKLLAEYQGGTTSPERRDVLWIKIDTAEWLDHLINTPCQNLLFAGDFQETAELLRDAARLKMWRSRLLVALPPFIPEHELDAWKSIVDQCRRAGIPRGACANLSHAVIFGKGFECVADVQLGCLNRASQAAVRSMGFGAFIYSYEDDYLNIKASASDRGVVCLFSFVPLFISRIHPAVRMNTRLADPHGNRFITAEANGLFYLLPEEPMCLTHRRRKLTACGIHDFLIDLSFCTPDSGYLQKIIDCYKNGTRLPDTGLFNFKAGLK
jgi:U32 family peptidase